MSEAGGGRLSRLYINFSDSLTPAPPPLTNMRHPRAAHVRKARFTPSYIRKTQPTTEITTFFYLSRLMCRTLWMTRTGIRLREYAALSPADGDDTVRKQIKTRSIVNVASLALRGDNFMAAFALDAYALNLFSMYV